MKKTSFIIALIAGFTVSTLWAGEGTKPAAPDEKPAAAQKAKTKAIQPAKATTKTVASRQAITGSYINHDIRRSGMITDGSDPVLVIDTKMIQRSGASDVRQVLVHTGTAR